MELTSTDQILLELYIVMGRFIKVSRAGAFIFDGSAVVYGSFTFPLRSGNFRRKAITFSSPRVCTATGREEGTKLVFLFLIAGQLCATARTRTDDGINSPGSF